MKIYLKNPGNEQIDERTQILILIIRFVRRRSNTNNWKTKEEHNV